MVLRTCRPVTKFASTISALRTVLEGTAIELGAYKLTSNTFFYSDLPPGACQVGRNGDIYAMLGKN